MAFGFSKDMNTSFLPLKREEDTKGTKGTKDIEENHSHDFNLKVGNSQETFNISCWNPRKLMDAIRSGTDRINQVKDDQHITVQIGEASKDTAIATHFPCCLLENGELVTLRASKEEIEQEQERQDIRPKEDYCLFYIETKPGRNAKTAILFRSHAIKDFKKLCVYGVKGMTFRDALNNDGRFVDDLGKFKLADVKKDQQYVSCDQEIDRHEGKTFQICYDFGKKNVPPKAARSVKNVPEPKVIRADKVLQKAQRNNDEEEGKKLKERLKANSLNLDDKEHLSFSEETFLEALKKVDFGKAYNAFRYCQQMKELTKLGKSVGRLIIGQIKVGTAFVLFKNYILTNAHLLFHDGRFLGSVQIYVHFNYLTEYPKNNFYLQVKNSPIALDENMDYAILELDVSEAEEKKVPEGLMKRFSPMSKSGEACIIGHPNGERKQMDIVCIIEKEQRLEHVQKHSSRFQNDEIALSRFENKMIEQNIGLILMSDDELTYDTFMYHGASGSPLFNPQCQVVALHTSGFMYDYPVEGHVFEMARPVLAIFENFVMKLKNEDQTDLLSEVTKESENNTHLKTILESPEPMDTN